MSEHMFGPPPSEEQRAHMRRVQAHMEEYQALAEASEEAARSRVLRFAAVLCACRPWYAARADPAAAYCPVHGSVMVTRDGKAF